MKKLSIYAVFILFILCSCTKRSGNNSDSLILAGIKGSKGSEIVCINVDSGAVVNTTPIDCYVLGSTVYDPQSCGYGYVNCDSVFELVNPETGKLINSIKFPGYVSQAVIDTEDNLLIGRYSTITYGEDPDTVEGKFMWEGPPIYTNYVIRVDLATGTIVSQDTVDIGDGVYISCYYYDAEEKLYVMYRADQSLIKVNPTTGAVIKEVFVGRNLFNSVFNPDNQTLISLSYSIENDRNSLVVINPETGSVINEYLIDVGTSYCSNVSGYDTESNCYITVNGDYQVLFYDLSTGEIKKMYKLDDPITDIKFWRR